MTKSIPFEKTLADLEGIVQQLEKGDLSLDQSLKQFEKGIALVRVCQDTLTRAQQKVSLFSEQGTQALPFSDE